MIVISNGTVVTMDDARSVHFGGHVVIDGDRITAVGPGSYTGQADGAEVIDAAGMIVLPGLIDLHFHTAIGKGYSDHLPLWEYLEECWYPLDPQRWTPSRRTGLPPPPTWRASSRG